MEKRQKKAKGEAHRSRRGGEGGRGGNLIGLTYGDVQLFRGTFFSKKCGIMGITF